MSFWDWQQNGGEDGLRAHLVGSRGLLSGTQQRIAEREHAERVFWRHGLGARDLDLLGHNTCLRYINARRHVESALNVALGKTRAALIAQGFDFPLRLNGVELPPC